MSGKVLGHKELHEARQQVITDTNLSMDLFATLSIYRNVLTAMVDEMENGGHQCFDVNTCALDKAKDLLHK